MEVVSSRLAEKLDGIYHCGAWVNVVYPYSILESANVIGTQEVLWLASQTKVKPVHFISTVDVFASDEQGQIKPISESSQTGPVRSLYSGYAQSKHIAEQLVLAAGDRGLPIAIYRPSNIIGQAQTSMGQTSDFIARMIKGCIQTGIAPDLEAVLNIVPVDYVSRSIVDLSQNFSQNKITNGQV